MNRHKKNFYNSQHSSRNYIIKSMKDMRNYWQ